ncbi:MAG: M23 family metallopeptidase [Bacteroidales bacterium]|nr:M23 family metallopeptidase [Bacteroidales bacterium]
MKRIIPLVVACLMLVVGCSTTKTVTTTGESTIVLSPTEKAISNSFERKKGKLSWPVTRGRVICGYGNQPHPDAPSVTIENHGIDIKTNVEAPVRAIFKGEVSSLVNIMGEEVVMIRHGEYISVYKNLTDICVKKGDVVSTKQTIGTVANNRTSDNNEMDNLPSMHFELWKTTENINPEEWLSKKIK